MGGGVTFYLIIFAIQKIVPADWLLFGHFQVFCKGHDWQAGYNSCCLPYRKGVQMKLGAMGCTCVCARVWNTGQGDAQTVCVYSTGRGAARALCEPHRLRGRVCAWYGEVETYGLYGYTIQVVKTYGLYVSTIRDSGKWGCHVTLVISVANIAIITLVFWCPQL